MSANDRIEFREQGIPLTGISDNATELVEMFGGRVEEQGAHQIAFVLPARRGVAAAGGIGCTLSWNDSDDGTVILSAGRQIAAPRISHVALLLVGAIGAVLWVLWPFFPEIAQLSWIGGALAFAAYFLALRRSPGGIAADLLERLVRRQREQL